MTIQDLLNWRKDFRTWKELADHLGYTTRYLEKIRNGDCPISAKIELTWLKEKMFDNAK